MKPSSGCSADVTEPFALRVIGDSMNPEFKDGNIIIVDPGHPISDGVYIVIEHQNEVLFGQFLTQGNTTTLHYLNSNYPPVKLTGEYQVKGVVTQRSTGRRKESKTYYY